MRAKPEEIVSVLREEIQNYDTRVRRDETGTVLEVGDGIATVYGLDQAVYGELGGEDEVDAVTAGLFAGVAAIASAHCRDRDSLLRRQAIRRALENGAFDYVVMLAGRGRPGEVAGIFETEAWLHENSGLAPHRGGGTAPRFDGGGRTPAAGVDARPTVPVYGQIGGSDPLYCGAGGRAADSG